MLYNKWRPTRFADISGQPHITKTLQKQVQTGRLAHAYLFTGSRGTGKTSCAKLLARAVNCQSPHDGEPCNQCPACLGIQNGSIPDVNEIDAASNSGVDNIRALREELVYAPVMVRYRVYIIDEVHMLSTGAFNALLKTLEEPPSHALFILATTETHKVPATIVSRCQRFAFRRIPRDGILERLQMVCREEPIAAEPAALELLAHMADGSLRDALSLLEQCASGVAQITEASVRETLGLAGLYDMARFLHELNDLSASLRHSDELYQSGMDFSAILGQMSSLLRDLLMGQMLGDLSITRLPHETAESLRADWPKDRILWALSLLSDTQNRLARSADKRLEAELCLIRLSDPQITAQPPAPIQPTQIPPSSPAKKLPHKQASQPTEEKPPEPPQPSTPSEPPNPPVVPGNTVEAARDPRWASLLASLNALNRDALSKAGASVNGDRLIIGTDDHFILGVIRQKDLQKQIQAFFPGGTEESAGAAPADQGLDALIRDAGDLVIEE